MNERGQAGTEAIVVISILLLVFVTLGVLAITQSSQTSSLQANLNKQEVCNKIASVITQLHYSGSGAKWESKLIQKDVNIYTSGFIEVADTAVSPNSVSCTFLGFVDQDYELSPSDLTFENIDGNVVVTVG